MMVAHPVPAVISVVIRGDDVLLVKRQNEPDAGRWGFPGGKIEFGETVSAAALRELREETGIHASAGDVLTAVDVITDSDTGQKQQHFLLIALQCSWISGDPTPGDDALDARWMPVEDVLSSAINQSANVDRVLEIALRRIGCGGA